MQSEQDTPDQVASTSNPSSTNHDTSKSTKSVYVWSWKETPSQMEQHPASSIVGDASDCWIRYGRHSNARLEAAYQNYCQNQDASSSVRTLMNLDDTYVVDLHTMIQVNKRTGFQRDVQRTIDAPKVWCWKEIEGLMWKHNPSTIYGNPSDCWIKYDTAQNELLESAYLDNDGQDEVSPKNGLVVNFEDMIETNEVTGSEREVQRVDFKQPEEEEEEEDRHQIVPDTAASTTATSAASAVAAQSTSTTTTPKKTKVWCWQETDGFMWRHDASTIYGDPSDSNWIKYDDEATAILEDGFQTQPFGIVSPCEGYNVNLAVMKQINIATGFERKVQRVDAITIKTDDDDEEEEDSSETANEDTLAQVQQMETRLQSKLQNHADSTDQKLQTMSTRQTAMETELEAVRSQWQETQSELTQTKLERDELKEQVASMKDCLDGLQKMVEESLTKKSQTKAPTTVVHDSGVGDQKKRSCADVEEPVSSEPTKRRRQEDEHEEKDEH
ncbi:unnamed protein product [Cylindrotheca closterium]|uniref:WWE domain-containing protein n=1 Tax=Cylindrotheca closterium TaxID=2856 RepID=A0AAD2JN36_9STRA|nr:unnamed protein product [Cylindrotheca closterium]